MRLREKKKENKAKRR